MVKELFETSLFAGTALSLLGYMLGAFLKKKCKNPLLNPLLISIIISIVVLVVAGVDYETYNASAKYLSYLLTPSTVCLAIPLYEQLPLLKKNFVAIVLGIFSGALTSVVCVFVLSKLMQLSHEEYVSQLPKSVTTAIGIGVSEELGGYVTITIAVIVITGILGNLFAEIVYKIFRITEPIAKGVGIGTSSHAMGTAKAIEMGEVEGAMSGLSIVVAGIFTVILAPIFANFH